MISYDEQVFWNMRSYGKAVRVRKGLLRGLFVIGCLITPCTNWLVPFVSKIIRQDIILRYEG